MLDIRAYCDESETSDHVVLAGAVAAFPVWNRLAEDWNALLAREGLHELHAVDCVHRRGEYAGRDKTECERLLRQFLEVIQSHKGIHGVFVAIDMDAWSSLVSAMGWDTTTWYSKPWMVGFGTLLPLIAQRSPANEPIAFLFDEKREFELRAHLGFQLFKDSMPLDNPLMPKPIAEKVKAQLGRLDFGRSDEHPGLQVADVLAYETRLRLRIDRTPRASWIRTTQEMTSVLVAYLGQSTVDRIVATTVAGERRGLTRNTLTEAALAEITPELPPLVPSVPDVLPNTLDPGSIAPVGW